MIGNYQTCQKYFLGMPEKSMNAEMVFLYVKVVTSGMRKMQF